MTSIDELVSTARARLARLGPSDVAVAMASGALLVDTRPVEQRRRDGEVPGAVVIDRNVLEWRLDPTSPDRVPEATGYEQLVVVMCDEGYASSLAAAVLQDLGLTRATDLEGGFRAWKTAGLPVTKAHGV
jgi:rhodanese-related sulfurtransferase